MLSRPKKEAGRWQITANSPGASASSGIVAILTRKGVEVFGWYDHIVGVDDPLVISWQDLLDAKVMLDNPQQFDGEDA